MPRNVYRNTSERKETARARQAFCDFRDMGPNRSLPKLLEKYRTSTDDRPTRNLSRLKFWSQVWNWQARVAIWESELDYARCQEQLRQVERQAAENARVMQAVGSGALGIASLALNRYVDSQSGALVEPIPLRDLPQLMRAGAELIQLAVGSPTSIVTNTGDTTQLERCLREADAQTRAAVLNGLRAALAWHERTKQGGA